MNPPVYARLMPAAAWLVTGAALFLLDSSLSLGNLALILLLGSTLASLWQSPTVSAISSVRTIMQTSVVLN